MGGSLMGAVLRVWVCCEREEVHGSFGSVL